MSDNNCVRRGHSKFLHTEEVGCEHPGPDGLIDCACMKGFIPGFIRENRINAKHARIILATIKAQDETISQWQECGENIMEAVTGKRAQLSDSDVIGAFQSQAAEIERLRGLFVDAQASVCSEYHGGAMEKCDNEMCREAARLSK